MRIELLLSRLKRLRKTPTGWAADCPAHGDSNRSLGVAAGEASRIVVTCRAGCDTAAIANALDVDAAQLLDRPAAESAAVAGRAVANVVTLADVQPESVEWLWAGRIPRGKLTLLDGDPGLGKSTVAYDIAARATRGIPMPYDPAPAAPGDVVLLSHEDGLADTIRPRLEAAAADLRRVHAIQTISGADRSRLPVLPADLDSILAIVEGRAAVLLIIDPLFAYLASGVDSFRDHDVRAALAPLAAAAERSRAAVLIVRHLNKRTGGPALYRGGGSIGIIGLARSGLVVAPDPADATQRILASVKNNLGAPAPSLRWKLVGTETGAARVEWLGATDHSADALLAESSEAPSERSAIQAACEFLRDLLADGEVAATEVARRAREEGISPRTLDRAKRQLSIRHRKQFGSGKFTWFLATPSSPSAASEPAVEELAAMAELADMSTSNGYKSATVGAASDGGEAFEDVDL
jgi:hypothetical protein